MLLDGFLDFSGSKTAGADFDGFLLTVEHSLNFNEIRFPDPSCFIMSMADIIAGYSALSTYITFTSHNIPTFCLYTGLVTYQNFNFM